MHFNSVDLIFSVEWTHNDLFIVLIDYLRLLTARDEI